MMTSVEEVRNQLAAAGQEHLLRYWAELSAAEQAHLLTQIKGLDLPLLSRMHAKFGEHQEPVTAADLDILPAHNLPTTTGSKQEAAAAEAEGLAQIHAGKVGAILVAGGQGTRLGFEHPKGMFGIGPVRGTSFFQIYAETFLVWQKRIGRPIPWYIMTSPSNHEETRDFFEDNGWFGLDPYEIHFFIQGTLPALDAATGRVLLADKHQLATSPNGHGGLLLALKKSGALADMQAKGLEYLYYFQIDNVFAKLLDPAFIGHHVRDRAEVSVKVVRKSYPTEKMGLVVARGGKPGIIEYSDLPEEIAHAEDHHGRLKFWAGNTAMHVFSRSFLERLVDGEFLLPLHLAHKIVPHLSDAGVPVTPEKPNGLKFEYFVFDALPLAARVSVMEVARHEEFQPVKNATGPDSVDTARAAMLRRAGEWLKVAGISCPEDDEGRPLELLEISPLVGLTAEEFAHAMQGQEHEPVCRSTYFGPDGRWEGDGE